jgi:glycosyltransferase involved in cell wall biosynthesis
MRILLVGMGGVNAAFRNWTEPSLANALVERGHDVYSYSYLDPNSAVQRLRDETVEGVHVHRVGLGPIGFSMDLWRAMRRDPPPDIVHIHHLRNELAWQVVLYFRRRRIPVVLSPIGLLHDRFITDDRDDPFSHPVMFDNLIFNTRGLVSHLLQEFTPRKHLRNWLTHFPLHLADHLIALSEFEKGLFVKLGVPADKITVIPFAVDVKLIDRALAANKPPRDWHYTRPVLLFIGQLKYRKGFDLLIRAASLVRAEFPAASFVFLTHNLSQREAFMRIVDEVGGRDCVFLVKQEGGPDTEPEKMRQYAASDVFVFPTRYEGFGIPLLEAMACRVPIISTRIPVIDEIIQDGETGVLARRNDANDLARQIIGVLKDDPLRQRLAANGRARVEACYTEPQLGERTEEVYRRVLAVDSKSAAD